MKKTVSLNFKLGEPNGNGRIYEKESFTKALKEAVENKISVYVGDEPFDMRDQIGQLISVENLKEGEFPIISMEIFSKPIIDMINNGADPFVPEGFSSVVSGTLDLSNKVVDIHKVEYINVFPVIKEEF